MTITKVLGAWKEENIIHGKYVTSKPKKCVTSGQQKS